RDLADRTGTLWRPEGDRARQRSTQPSSLRSDGHLADDLRGLERDGARRARGARARTDPPARAAQGEPRDRRGTDRQELAVGGQARREPDDARGGAADLRDAERASGDRG